MKLHKEHENGEFFHGLDLLETSGAVRKMRPYAFGLFPLLTQRGAPRSIESANELVVGSSAALALQETLAGQAGHLLSLSRWQRLHQR